MSITERTLKKWRKEALQAIENINKNHIDSITPVRELQERILRLTQELLDQLLIK